MRAIRRFTVRAALPEPLAPLRDLTLNLRWSWHAGTRELFAAIDPAGWDAAGHDPVALLGEVPPAQLESLGHDPAFLRRLDDAARDLDQYLTGPRWYQLHADGGSDPAGPPAAIAYFSPEYGITQALPQYSGGLGILAGDHLKAGSDLGVPLIGVGLLYRHGYFTQSLSPEGWQMERYPAGDPNGLPLTLLRAPDGTAVRVSVALAEGKLLSAQIWVAQVGRVPLLLLDSYVEENEPTLREVTDRLYGGGGDHRLRQELLLGMGGVRALRAFCALTGHAEPEVFHTNEGHAGFLGLERIREYAERGLSFEEAIELCRAGTVFTTHTPVPAGIDRFNRDLLERHFTGAAADPALPIDRVLALGAETFPGGDPSVFNMAVMGMRLAQRVNGVSRAPRRGQPGNVRRPVARVRHRPGADRLDHQRRARPRRGWPRRSWTWPAGRRRTPPWLSSCPRTGTPGSASRTRPRPGCGRSAAPCEPGWLRWPASGCAPPGGSAAPATRNWAGSTRSSTTAC